MEYSTRHKKRRQYPSPQLFLSHGSSLLSSPWSDDHTNSLIILKFDIKLLLLCQTIHGLRVPTQRIRVMKNTSIPQRLPKLTRDYKTFHQYSTYIQPNYVFLLWTQKCCITRKKKLKKNHSVLSSLGNFSMVMQWTLKTIMLTFFDASHQRRWDRRWHIVIY